MPEYPASKWQTLVGKTIALVEDTTEGDEGFKIIFTDGSWFEFMFSGCEGVIDPLREKQP